MCAVKVPNASLQEFPDSSWAKPAWPSRPVSCRCLLRFCFVLILWGMPDVLAAQQPSPPQEVSGAEAEPPSNWHFRFEMFQMLLEQNGLTAITSLEQALDQPRQSVIVILGDPGGTMHPRLMESYCRNGGALLLASDRSYLAGRIAAYFGGPVQAETPEDRYQRFSDCIVVRNLQKEHPLVKGVSEIIVNRSGWLAMPRWNIPDWDVVAQLPTSCAPRESSDQPVLATVRTAERNSGPLILAADQSIFTNGMLWHGDNALLAINVSRYLTEGNRHQLVFIVNNVSLGSYEDSPVVQNANPQLPEDLPKPGLDSMLKVANSVLKNVEESNVLNEALANRPRNARPPYYWRTALFLLAAAATAFGIWKLADAGPTPHQPVPQREMKTAHELSSASRPTSLDYGMAARILARDLCREMTGTGDVNSWKNFFGETSSTSLGRLEKSRRKELSTLLELAVGTKTIHISRRRFESLGTLFTELRQGLRP